MRGVVGCAICARRLCAQGRALPTEAVRVVVNAIAQQAGKKLPKLAGQAARATRVLAKRIQRGIQRGIQRLRVSGPNTRFVTVTASHSVCFSVAAIVARCYRPDAAACVLNCRIVFSRRLL